MYTSLIKRILLAVFFFNSCMILCFDGLAQPKPNNRRPLSLKELKIGPRNTFPPRMMAANGNNGNGNNGNGNNGNGNNGNTGPNVPIDEDVVYLIVAGVGLGIYYIRGKNFFTILKTSQ